MSFQDLYGNGFQLGMPAPMPTPAQNNGGPSKLIGSLASGGMSALHKLLPALFTGSQTSTAAPSQTDASYPGPVVPLHSDAQPPTPNPTWPPIQLQPAAPVPLPQPRPAAANAPMSLAPPNPGPAMPNPTLNTSPYGVSPAAANAGAGGGAAGQFQPPQAMQPLVPQQQQQQGQGQGIIPRAANDIQSLMKMFGGSGGSLAGANAMLAGLY